MAIKKKIAITVTTLIVGMLIVPFAITKLAPADAGMGLMFICFFALDPLIEIGLSVMAGTDIRRLWWVPVVSAVSFPLLFAVAVWDIVVWDLFIYSGLYLTVGVVAMLGTHFGFKCIKKKSKGVKKTIPK